jgi:hypothetical protein
MWRFEGRGIDTEEHRPREACIVENSDEIFQCMWVYRFLGLGGFWLLAS